ncbi:MAG: hypothetical protein ACHQT6_12125 [Candidatus Acidiferrales bacterium]
MLNFLAGHGDTLAFLGGLVVLIGALFDAFLEHSKHREKYRPRRRQIAFGIAVGGFLSIVGAFGGSRHSEEMQRRLATKSDELATFVAGGDSYCYVASGFENMENPSELPFYFFQNGNNPVWDVKLIITDAYEYQSKLPALPPHSFVPEKSLTPAQIHKIREAENTKMRVYVGNLIPGENGAAFTKPARPDKQRYEIQIITRSGYFVETLVAQKVDGRWVSAYRVWKSALRMSDPNQPPREQVAEFVNSDFPKNELPWK